MLPYWRLALVSFCLIFLMVYACSDKEELPSNGVDFLHLPSHFPEMHYQFTNNTPSMEVFELGRALFYDPILSIDSSIHCGSCHHQEIAFSDDAVLSEGVHGRMGIRNSPPLFNLAWHPTFMWDGGITHIELMPIAPITDSLEMALPLRKLGERLNRNDYYKKAFKNAMGVDSITDRSYLIALAQFMSAMISADSPYDRYAKGESGALNEMQLAGLEIFRKSCATCHSEPLFTDYSFRINGTAKENGDAGRSLVTQLSTDYGRFKVPSLRNITLTAPYMHDGRFSTLDEVLDHYANPGDNPLLDESLSGGISLNVQEREQLKAFLHSLTDEKFTRNDLLANPWK